MSRNKDELTVFSPASTVINGDVITIENVDAAIEHALEELNKTGDNEKIDSMIRNLVGLEKISKFALAHIFAGYQEWWEKTKQSEKKGDSFNDYMQAVNDVEFEPANDLMIRLIPL